MGEYDETGSPVRSYGYEPDSLPTTNPLWLKRGGSYYWYVNDALGTPQMLLDTNGNGAWSATYESFGRATVTFEAVENPLRFAGQYYDAETGLHHNHHRYYDPGTGRYLTPDPARSGSNWYAYVENRPTAGVDPLGLMPAWFHTKGARDLANLLLGGLDAVTFDQGTRLLGKLIDLNGVLDKCSPYYRAGWWGGMIAGIFIGDALFFAGKGVGALLRGAGRMLGLAERLATTATGSLGRMAKGIGSLLRGESRLAEGVRAAGNGIVGGAVKQPGIVLWSGGARAEDAATWLANNTGKTTLGMTELGAKTDLATVGMDYATQARPIWEAASKQFVESASGEVTVVLSRSANKGSIYFTTEWPALLKNPNITSVKFIHIP